MIFKVLDGKTITVRKAAIVGTNDYVGTLASHTEFSAETVEKTADRHWVRILSGPHAGYFCAVVYKSQVFAELIEEPPAPPTEDEIVKAVIYFGDGRTQELFPSA